jgi:glycosyltransferase involved in cell wall biosynthesis
MQPLLQEYTLSPKYSAKNIPSVTIIIPAYNEEKRIGRVLQEISEFITTNSPYWNVIVSIDGNDGTEEIVKDYSKKYSFISYIKNGNRAGKGGAIKRVVSEARGEFTVIMDADGSVNFQTIAENLGLVRDYDVILFERYSKQGNRIPALRRIPSRGFNALVRVLVRVRVNDTQCGYKIIRTQMLKRAFSQVSITNAFFDVALLFYLKGMGARIGEVSVAYSHDEESKFNVVALVLGLGVSLIAFRVRHSRFYKYVPEWAEDLYYRKFRWI